MAVTWQLLLVVSIHILSSHSIAGYQVAVKLGNNLTLDLPSVRYCGSYTLLSPLLRPIVIVDGANTTNVIGDYFRRAEVAQTDSGFRFTILEAQQSDMGRYKVAASQDKSDTCVDRSYFVTVIAANEEYFKPWSEWSVCGETCSPHFRRSRSRQCTLAGGCGNIGPTIDSQQCNLADECGHWSTWGSWGSCSAKCGKGFKMRKRACVSGNSVLVRTSLCTGHATQSHMCLTVCEVVGTWSEWSEWTMCQCEGGTRTMCQCEGGTRTRTRNCSTETIQRVATANCTGNRTEQEACLHSCTGPEVTTNSTFLVSGGIVTGGLTSPEATLSISSMVAGVACAVAVIIIFIVVLLLKRRIQRRRESVPALRPVEEAPKRRAKKTSKTSQTSGRKSGGSRPKSGGSRSKSGSGNVYSELTSGFQWPSSEFDSTYAVHNDGFSPEIENAHNENARAALEMVADDTEQQDDDCDDMSNDSDEFDHQFDDAFMAGRETMCERKEITYATQRVSFQRPSVDGGRPAAAMVGGINTTRGKGSSDSDAGHATEESEDEVVTENLYYEPPELWAGDQTRFDSLDKNALNNVLHQKSWDNGEDEDRIYYEPPAEENKIDKLNAGRSVPEFMREESVYENCEVDHGTLRLADDIENVYEPIDKECYKAGKKNGTQVETRDVKTGTKKKTRKVGIDNSNAKVPPSSVCPRYSDVLQDTSVANIDTNVHAGGDSDVKQSPSHEVNIDTLYSRDDLDGDHTYVNGKANNNSTDFYVTPKYHYGVGQVEPTPKYHYGVGQVESRQKKESIYDVPR